jgi:hypothetical protein
MSVTSVRLSAARHESPRNEIPAVVPTPALTWRGDGIVIAIPSLQVYSTGTEFVITGRFAGKQPRTTEHAAETGSQLDRIRVNGAAVSMLGGEYEDFGFTYVAWMQHQPDRGELVFRLDWPGLSAERAISAELIRDAVARITRP